ncbi:MAG: hypothetical protein AAGA37_07965 [Actinomycetota bacterium]
MSAEELHILLVCEDNVCLSPLVAGLLARHAYDSGVALRVASAGLGDEERPFDPTIVWILKSRSIAFDRKASQPLDTNLVDGADLILTMTGQQARDVKTRFPWACVFAIGHFGKALPARPTTLSTAAWLDSVHHFPDAQAAAEHWDIDDPTGEPESAYLKLEVRVDHLVRRIVAKLGNSDATAAEPGPVRK